MTRLDPHSARVPAGNRRGRGAVSNAAGRYEPQFREGVDDGWLDEEPLEPISVEVTEETPRTIISRNTSPDIPFDRSLNAYRGCEHGCIYCYARPTHAYLGLSPGLDFETKLTVKPAAASLLRRAFNNPRYRPALLAMGTNTDPYQPLERERRITRSLLEVLLDYRHPFSIVTKSALVIRDLDLLAQAAELGLAQVALSVTTLDHRLSRRMEPRASAPKRRLWAIERLSEAGVPTLVMAGPMIPALNDHEMEGILGAARRAGARDASYTALRMPLEIKDLFREWLATHFPDRQTRILRHIREMHGGKDYAAAWGRRMRGDGVYAELLAKRFRRARAGFDAMPALPVPRSDLFRRPVQDDAQFDLFAAAEASQISS